MPNWKALVNRSHSKDSFSRKSQSKYNPKRQTPSNSGINMFENKTISRVQRSLIDSQVNNRSHSSKISFDRHQSRKLLPSASQHRIRKNNNAEVLYRANGSQKQMHSPIKVNNLVKMSSKSIDNEQSHLFVELYKLKNQFKMFQETVMSELKRQENVLSSMFEEVLKNLKTYLNNGTKIQQSLQNQSSIQPMNLKISIDSQVGSIQKNIKQDQREPSSERRKQLTSPRNNAKLKDLEEQVLFSKFFKAINCLKQEMKEIGKMSLIGDKIKSYSDYDPKFLRAGTQELTTNESSKNIKP